MFIRGKSYHLVFWSTTIFQDTQVSLAPTHVCLSVGPSVRWSVILLNFHSISVSGCSSWKVEERQPQLFFNFGSALLWIISLQVWTVVTKMWCRRVQNWQRFCPLVIIYHQHEADKNIFLSLNQCCVMNLLFILLQFKALIKGKHKPMFSFLDQLA